MEVDIFDHSMKPGEIVSQKWISFKNYLIYDKYHFQRKVNLWNQDTGILNDLQLKKNLLQAFHPRRYEEREFTTNIHQHLQSFRLQGKKKRFWK